MSEVNNNNNNMSEESTATINLISKDGKTFTVPTTVACMSVFVKTAAGEDGEDDMNTDNEGSPTDIDVPNVRSQVLEKILEFCYHHNQEPMSTIPKPIWKDSMVDVVQKWYSDFVESLDQVMLFELILAANYMDIPPLMELTSATVALVIKRTPVEDCRTMFHIENDFTPEEMAEVLKEDKWSNQQQAN